MSDRVEYIRKMREREHAMPLSSGQLWEGGDIDALLASLREVEREHIEDLDRAARLAVWLEQAEQRVAELAAALAKVLESHPPSRHRKERAALTPPPVAPSGHTPHMGPCCLNRT